MEPLVSNAAFCVCLGGTGRLSCVNPFSILHRGVVFFGFQKNKLSGNDFSVGFFFSLCYQKFCLIQCNVSGANLPLKCCGIQQCGVFNR